MNPKDKLYLVVRGDLLPGQQAVQALHAFREFMEQHKELEQHWYSRSNYLAFLSVRDEIELGKLWADAQRRGIRCSYFKEPDLSHSLTALAIEPKGRVLCKKLKLALK